MGFGRRFKRTLKKAKGAAFNPKLAANVAKGVGRNPYRLDKTLQRHRTTGQSKRTMVKTGSVGMIAQAQQVSAAPVPAAASMETTESQG